MSSFTDAISQLRFDEDPDNLGYYYMPALAANASLFHLITCLQAPPFFCRRRGSLFGRSKDITTRGNSWQTYKQESNANIARDILF